MRLLPLIAAVLLACDPPEPVLPGVTADALEDDPTDDGPAPYQKADGVYVDVQYLAGKPWASVRDQVTLQLGDVVETRDLDPRDGQEIELTRGTVRTKGGEIYFIRVELPEPLRRGRALEAVGLPAQADGWIGTHRDWSLRWSWNFALIRMGQVSPRSETVAWVEATRWDPRKDRRQ